MVMTFRELVQARYLALGMGLFDAKYEIRRESGVSMGVLRNAYDGTRIKPEPAAALMTWAMTKHGVALGMVELMSAPTRQREVVDWGKRAEDAIRRVLSDAGLPTDGSVGVQCRSGLWAVGRDGEVGIVGYGRTLEEAARELQESRKVQGLC